MDAFMAMIAMYGFNWAPKGWALCNGQLLPISQYSAVFSLIGTTYGGNGQTNFALPDLRGRVPVHQGAGPGLTPRNIGDMSGTESNSLTIPQMPAHTHAATVTAQLCAESTAADKRNPLGAMLATPPASAPIFADPVPADNKVMASDSIQATATIQMAGGSQPVNNMQPFAAVSFCICLEGIFPSRN